MRPLFRLMQTRIDTVNRVLREQITGIRVVRAFVREPYETARFARANGELTDAATCGRPADGADVPDRDADLNVSSVAVLWFGAQRVEDGAMQIGTLTAFLTYLMQILMSVMMATFLLMMARAPRSAPNGSARCWTPSRRWSPPTTGHRPPPRGRVELRDAEFTYPGPRSRSCATSTFARPGQTTAIIGSTGAGKTTLIS